MGSEESLIVIRYPRSPAAEAFRALRTNIQFSSVDKPVRTLAITSSNPEEGKSVLAANLAVTMAQLGRSVVIIDADMRRPRQHDIFDLENSRGLSNVILEPQPDLSTYSWRLTYERLSRRFLESDGEIDIERDESAWIGDLRVITSGPIPPNPADLLGSGRMEALIESLKDQADVIIFDTPPVLAVTDAVVLATRVDGVLLVNDARRTRRGMVRRAVGHLRQVGAPLLGVVLNRVSSSGDGYYTYQHYYGYGGDKLRARSRSWLNLGRLLPRLASLGKLKRSDNAQRQDSHHPVHTGDPVSPGTSDEKMSIGKEERKSGQVL
ncbi:MAG: CpsD/CapB family tyrosine-protein kinase [Anaerolineae bacterium]|nr:CpsD/CapB family tyrosine-protein kinase [Anaerolineae bacterium]